MVVACNLSDAPQTLDLVRPGVGSEGAAVEVLLASSPAIVVEGAVVTLPDDSVVIGRLR